MATSVDVTSAYVGDVESTIFTLAVDGNQAVEKGSVHVEPGVELELFLPRFNTEQDALQARVADPQTAQASESFTYDERSIKPLDAMFYDEFNPRNNEVNWRPFQPAGPLVDRVENPAMQSAIMEGAIKSVGSQIGRLIWAGDTGGAAALAFFDGYLKIAAADGALAVTPAGVITPSNVIAILEACVALIPDALYDNPNMVINMNTTDLRNYQTAARALDFKGSNITDALSEKFAGFQIRHYAGLTKDHILTTVSTAGTDSNLWAATAVINDVDNPKIARKSSMSELFGIKILFKYAVNMPNPTEAVLYEPV